MSLVPGIVTETINTLVPVQGAPANAILVIGHVGATLPGSIRPFTATEDGDVLEFSSLSDALDALGGPCDGTGWVPGVADSGAGATTPYDNKDNLLRALDLVYAGNSGAKVYCCVLDGVSDPLTGTSSLPNGAQRAMDVMNDYFDTAFVNLANLDPVAAGVSHAEGAASENNPYNSPRFYVCGLDQFKLWDTFGGNGTPTGGVKQADFSSWTTEKSAEGLVLNYFGNHEYDFSRVVDSIIPADVVVEIGGQLASAWLCGMLSARADGFAVTQAPALAIPMYDGNKYIFKSKTELNNIIAEGYICTRFFNNSYTISKGVTFTSAVKWTLYPHRQITNGVHKSVAINLMQFVGETQTTSLFIGAKQATDQIMDDKKSSKLIKTFSTEVKPDDLEVDAIKAVISFETTKPVNKIKVTLSVS